MTDQQPHTPHIEEVCSAYVQYHHFNSYGMDDSEETEKSFYRMIARIVAAAEQRVAVRGKVEGLREAADEAGSWGPACINAALAIRRSADLLEGVE